MVAAEAEQEFWEASFSLTFYALFWEIVGAGQAFGHPLFWKLLFLSGGLFLDPPPFFFSLEMLHCCSKQFSG